MQTKDESSYFEERMLMLCFLVNFLFQAGPGQGGPQTHKV